MHVKCSKFSSSYDRLLRSWFYLNKRVHMQQQQQATTTNTTTTGTELQRQQAREKKKEIVGQCINIVYKLT